MKSQHNKSYFPLFKYLMIIPIVIIIGAIVIGAIFGFNKDYDFRTVSTFNVKFNTTVTEAEYDMLEDEVYQFVKASDFGSYRIDRIGEGAQNGIIIKIANDDGIYDNQINSLKSNIEDNLLASIDSSIESSVVITTTDTVDNLPKNVQNVLIMGSLAILAVMAFTFVYLYVRYNLISAVSSILSQTLSIALLTSLLILFRIPLNYYFTLTYFVMSMLIVYNWVFINNKLKETLGDEKFNKTNNTDRMNYVLKASYKNVLILSGALLIALIPLMFFGGISLLFTILSVLLGIITSLFVTFFFAPCIWIFWYKKDNDIRLRKRLEAKEQKKDGIKDDKLVV